MDALAGPVEHPCSLRGVHGESEAVSWERDTASYSPTGGSITASNT